MQPAIPTGAYKIEGTIWMAPQHIKYQVASLYNGKDELGGIR